MKIDLILRYKQGSSGKIVGFFREFPFLASQSNLLDDLIFQLKIDLDTFFVTFPLEKEKILKRCYEMNTHDKISPNNPPEIVCILNIDRPEIGSNDTWCEKKIQILLKYDN